MWFQINRSIVELGFMFVSVLYGYGQTKCTGVGGLKVTQQLYPLAFLHL